MGDRDCDLKHEILISCDACYLPCDSYPHGCTTLPTCTPTDRLPVVARAIALSVSQPLRIGIAQRTDDGAESGAGGLASGCHMSREVGP